MHLQTKTKEIWCVCRPMPFQEQKIKASQAAAQQLHGHDFGFTFIAPLQQRIDMEKPVVNV